MAESDSQRSRQRLSDRTHIAKTDTVDHCDMSREVFDAISDAIMDFDASTLQFVDANESVLNLYGYTHQEFLELTHTDVTAEPEKSRESFEQLRTGENSDVPLRYHKKKDGTVFPVEISAGKFERDGQLFFCGSVRDISESVRIQTALRESEQRYRNLFDSSAELIQSVTPDGSFIYVNPAWKKALGYSDEDLSDLNVLDVVHPESQEHYVTTMFQRILSGEDIDILAATFLTKDGRRLMVEGSSNCLFDGDIPVSTRSIFRDVTERRTAHDAIKSAHDQLESRVAERTAALTKINAQLQEQISEREELEKVRDGLIFRF